MTPFGITLLTIAAAAGLLTWFILAKERREKQ